MLKILQIALLRNVFQKRKQCFDPGFWFISLTRCELDRVTIEIRHIHSFTHEPLWVVSHTAWRCASRDSTNQNASFVEWFSCLERAVYRGICGKIFALFQACVRNFGTIPPWKAVGTLYLDSSGVSFKYVAFLRVCDKFELLGRVQAAMMIWVLFSPFFLDSLLVTVSGYIGLFQSTCYFNLSSL